MDNFDGGFTNSFHFSMVNLIKFTFIVNILWRVKIAPLRTRTRDCISRVRRSAGLSIPGRDIYYMSCSAFIFVPLHCLPLYESNVLIASYRLMTIFLPLGFVCLRLVANVTSKNCASQDSNSGLYFASQALCRLVHSRPGHLLYVVQCIYIRSITIFSINWQFCLKIWWGIKYWLPNKIKVWWGNCPTCPTYSASHVYIYIYIYMMYSSFCTCTLFSTRQCSDQSWEFFKISCFRVSRVYIWLASLCIIVFFTCFRVCIVF